MEKKTIFIPIKMQEEIPATGVYHTLHDMGEPELSKEALAFNGSNKQFVEPWPYSEIKPKVEFSEPEYWLKETTAYILTEDEVKDYEQLKGGGWVSVEEGLPYLVDDLIGVDDDGNFFTVIEKHSATVLAFEKRRGVFKARLTKNGWAEVSTTSIDTTCKPTHWQPLPPAPQTNKQ